ncbi:efflux RND transporter periplasmic adaptor subunit [Pseudovibrio exalbescens]|uniref:efflux RND transporter periplasmic adaptor subunit n=1 Tax=Pseudovibrio exalbescens TaxID=197461 RepID=UPI002366323C|nr:efflux RND transporter periplasmic adaptor subunit [Pseudovibrio exalbescens]MDD7908949.1 efflux RND transporter periplasmic adaptor subunit [Pseudovibrio exalbescens]
MKALKFAATAGVTVAVVTAGYFMIGAPMLESQKLSGLKDLGVVQDANAATANAQPAGGPPGMGPGGPREVAVHARNVVLAQTDTFVRAIGTGRSIRTTDLYPETSGRVTTIAFTAGDKVQAGDTLFTLDNINEQLALRQAEIELQDAIDQVDRYQRLNQSQSQTISSVQLQDARIAKEKAELQLEKARVELNKRRVVAPFEGTLGIVDVEIGDLVDDKTRLSGLDDRAEILVEFVVPERFANEVAIGGRVELTTEAAPGVVFNGTISTIDNRVSSESRTLKLRALVSNPRDLLKSGLAFSVRVLLEGQEWPAVPPLALRWDQDGSYVWVARENKAQRLPVTIIERNSDLILVEADLKPGEVVITESSRGLREGAKLTITAQPGFSLQMPEAVSSDASKDQQTTLPNGASGVGQQAAASGGVR